MLDTPNANAKTHASSNASLPQEHFMSADKTKSSDSNSQQRAKRGSALLKVAETIDTSVDSSLDAFIAEANSTLDTLQGWAIGNDTSKEIAGPSASEEAEARALAAEQRALDLERETQEQLRSAQSQLAEAEARIAAAEQRAERAEVSAKSAKNNLVAVSKKQAKSAELAAATPEPAVAVTARVAEPMLVSETYEKRSSLPKIGLLLGIFVAGGALAFTAAKFMASPEKSADVPAPVLVAPAEIEEPVTPAVDTAVQADEAPSVMPLPGEGGSEEAVTAEAAAEAAAAEEATRLADEAQAADAANLAEAKAAKDAETQAAKERAAEEKAARQSNRDKQPVQKQRPKTNKSSDKKSDKKDDKKEPPKGGIVDPFA